jgi:hydroxyacylglutathione hydrolase
LVLGIGGFMHVITIETPELGDRSYLVHDGSKAFVLDPQRDIERVIKAAQDAGVEIRAVAETHIHNDYVTGGYELATRLQVPYYVNEADNVSFERNGVKDGSKITVGGLEIEVVATPGHTPNHLSYVVTDGSGEGVVLSGGSMLFGSVGRTDLISAELTEPLAKAQYHSVRRLAEKFPEHFGVFPTHGFGSFCSSVATTGGSTSTLGDEKRNNIVFKFDDEELFAKTIIAGLTAYPKYYAHMGRINSAGPRASHFEPPALQSAQDIYDRITKGEWVVDLRSRRDFAKAHIIGTYNIEYGNSFTTFFGWVVPFDATITLMAADIEQFERARIDLSRIGFDNIRNAVIGDVSLLGNDKLITSSYEIVSFADGKEIEEDFLIIDVRRHDEWNNGFIEGAKHVPLEKVHEIRATLDDERLHLIHCQSGYRASIAASLIEASGKRVRLIDDSFDVAKEVGFNIKRP